MGVFLIDSWDLNKQDEQIKYLREVVSISSEIVPLEQFYQTSCLGLLIFLITFLRQPVTKLGELVPHERFSLTGSLNI